MAVPLVAARQLAQALRGPQGEQLRSQAKRLGQIFAEQFGLTEEHEYVGWKILLLLAVELWENKLKAPVKAGWHIEQQIVAVLDQAYQFLGGAGNAVDRGIDLLKTTANAPLTASSEIEKAIGASAREIEQGAGWLVGRL